MYQEGDDQEIFMLRPAYDNGFVTIIDQEEVFVFDKITLEFHGYIYELYV